MREKIIRLMNINKSYGTNHIVKDLTLEVFKGEFLTLLGPSGCGKTTTLRMIGGFEEPNSGQVFINEIDVTNIPPNKRDVNTVFQNYALFPHMTVNENIEYGMRMKNIKKNERLDRVNKILKMVQMESFATRKPKEMSGGQQQRIAVARAIVNNPSVLLLDEPLGALDLKLRKEMQLELKHLQKSLGMTFIYVTHDQEEALTMSDRIAVMNDGRIDQLDTPETIYNNPKTVFIADFIGETNLLKGKVCSLQGEDAIIELFGHKFKTIRNGNFKLEESINVSIRPENLILSNENSYYKGVVKEILFAGSVRKLVVEIHRGEEVVLILNDDSRYSTGEEVGISWKHAPVVLS